jgi:hypothetical protein
MAMKHVVNVSGGAGSAVALFRVIDRYGRENVSARLADTNSEHPDLYRFVDDVEREAGIEITRLNNYGLNIWDIFFREMMFTNPKTGGCLAAWHLKKLPLMNHAATIGTPEEITIHVGFSIDEDDRISRLVETGKPWQFDFPLTWERPLVRCSVIDELHRRGIRECEVYEQGYPHANCLKWNCVLSGIGQWLGVLRDNPDGYRDAEEKEQLFLAELARRSRKVTTILRDRSGGVTKNLSLKQLREESESGIERKVPKWRDSTCSCVGTLFNE